MARGMTDEHKAALAKGRSEGKAVREYLEALRATKPKRGRKRTVETVRAQLERVHSELEGADPMSELLLLQQRRNLEDEIARLENQVDIAALESAFVSAAAGYSQSKGIAYATWREVGVEASVLKAAGISRSS